MMVTLWPAAAAGVAVAELMAWRAGRPVPRCDQPQQQPAVVAGVAATVGRPLPCQWPQRRRRWLFARRCAQASWEVAVPLKHAGAVAVALPVPTLLGWATQVHDRVVAATCCSLPCAPAEARQPLAVEVAAQSSGIEAEAPWPATTEAAVA